MMGFRTALLPVLDHAEVAFIGARRKSPHVFVHPRLSEVLDLDWVWILFELVASSGTTIGLGARI